MAVTRVDEVLDKALETDEVAIPRFDVVLPNGTKVAENAELVLKNAVVTAGMPVNKQVVDELLAASGTTSGTAAALTLAQTHFVLFDGALVRIKLHTELVGIATLNINATGAKPLVNADGNPLIGYTAGTWITLVYSSTTDSYINQGERSAVEAINNLYILQMQNMLRSNAALYRYKNVIVDSFVDSSGINTAGSWVQGSNKIRATQPTSSFYYYSKYNIDPPIPAHYESGSFSEVSSGDDVGSYSLYGYTSYEGVSNFSSSGWYQTAGSLQNTTITEMSDNGTYVAYTVSQDTVTRLTITKSSDIDDRVDYTIEEMSSVYVPLQNESRGSFIETITALNGEYPDDGTEDGYWWVKGSVAPPGPATLTLRTVTTTFATDKSTALLTVLDATDDATVSYKASFDNGSHWETITPEETFISQYPGKYFSLQIIGHFTGVEGSYVDVFGYGVVFL